MVGTKRNILVAALVLLILAIAAGIGLTVGLSSGGGDSEGGQDESSRSPTPTPTSGPTLSSSPTAAPTPAILTGVWTQVGQDILGEVNGDAFGMSIAMSINGSIVAIGAVHSDKNGDNSGHVRVYQDTDGTWTRLGGDIIGDNVYDLLGRSIALSNDGTILAIGVHYLYDGNGRDSGQVRVFRLVNGDWALIGSGINGRGTDDRFGISVALSADGKIVAAGTHLGDYVSVYQLQDENWIQVGADIVGDNSGFGQSVALSASGTTLAVGGDYSEEVQVFESTNGSDWSQVGNSISAGSTGDDFGGSVALSADGERVAVGAYQGDYAAVYKLGGNVGMQVGPNIFGDETGDWFGWPVSLSPDGRVLAVGARFNDSNGANAGQVRVFHVVDGDWELIGDPISGKGIGDEFGFSVSLSEDGTTVAVGAYQYRGGSGPPGYAAVYRLE